jgi:uncharacterized protein
MPQTARAIVLVLPLILVWTGCGEQPLPGPLAMDAQQTEDWEIALVEWRIEKNERFMDPEQTPLPASLLEGFEGLDYYFPEAAFRYILPLETLDPGATAELTLRNGETRRYAVRGTVRFQHAGRACELTVFGPQDGDPSSLWLPFRDQTNGHATYPGGRYLDLELAADGTVELDFNKAYNPLCAYDPERWNCTLPPAGNTLPLPVEAGEKLLVGVLP